MLPTKASGNNHLSITGKSALDTIRGRWVIRFLDDKIDLRGASVLDIGCGQGGISLPFAERSKEVYCGDISESSLLKLRDRVLKTDFKNVSLFNFNAISLPFKDGSFDLVIMNGALEFVPSGIWGNPREIQLNVLKEVKRVLKENGLFYLAIENRFFIGYFLGKKDHSGIRFITPLPRKLADIYAKIVSGSDYRHYIYGMKGYKEILEEANFKKINFYTAIPSYQYPEYIVNVRDNEEIKRCMNGVFKGIYKWSGQFLNVLKLYRVFGYNFVILSRK